MAVPMALTRTVWLELLADASASVVTGYTGLPSILGTPRPWAPFTACSRWDQVQNPAVIESGGLHAGLGHLPGHLCPRRSIQLAKYGAEVAFNCLRAEEELAGDGRIRASRTDQFGNLAFTSGEGRETKAIAGRSGTAMHGMATLAKFLLCRISQPESTVAVKRQGGIKQLSYRVVAAACGGQRLPDQGGICR